MKDISPARRNRCSVDKLIPSLAAAERSVNKRGIDSTWFIRCDLLDRSALYRVLGEGSNPLLL